MEAIICETRSRGADLDSLSKVDEDFVAADNVVECDTRPASWFGPVPPALNSAFIDSLRKILLTQHDHQSEFREFLKMGTLGSEHFEIGGLNSLGLLHSGSMQKIADSPHPQLPASKNSHLFRHSILAPDVFDFRENRFSVLERRRFMLDRCVFPR